MDEKIIKVTDKGQIYIPAVVREALAIYSGDNLILSRTEDAIVLRKIKENDFSDLLKYSESVAKKLWDNEGDEIWNEI